MSFGGGETRLKTQKTKTIYKTLEPVSFHLPAAHILASIHSFLSLIFNVLLNALILISSTSFTWTMGLHLASFSDSNGCNCCVISVRILPQEWNEDFTESLDSHPQELYIDVFDYDLVGMNDFLGRAKVSIASIQPGVCIQALHGRVLADDWCKGECANVCEYRLFGRAAVMRNRVFHASSCASMRPCVFVVIFVLVPTTSLPHSRVCYLSYLNPNASCRLYPGRVV